MSFSNRRKFKRFKIDRSVKVPIHIFPVMPFIGEPVEATIINLSAGGIGLAIEKWSAQGVFQRGSPLKIHFRLPGRPLQECRGIITHSFRTRDERYILGIRFIALDKGMVQDINQMAADNEFCDRRIKQDTTPWCVPICSFYHLCRKPIRHHVEMEFSGERLEITLQSIDEFLTAASEPSSSKKTGRKSVSNRSSSSLKKAA
ncbi:MAG: PilZ domain-containing protein [Elusimicrobia bacterium]|nr:PilZ domain-containing protein [Candidatus Obscuribacterium magneticum]MCB4755495.1 PilZ domain-containing protein [Candidatus Obscuribacterium magneticum]